MTAGARVGSTVRLAAFCAGLVLAARVLVAAGARTLSIPLGSLADLESWVATASPAEMAMAVVRLLAIAACGYLLAVTAIGVAARLVRARTLSAAVDRISPAVVRRLVSGGTGAGLVIGTLVASVPAPDFGAATGASTIAAGTAAAEPVPASADAATATMARVPPTTATMTRLDDVAAPSATMTRVDAGGPSAATPTTPAPTTATPAAVADAAVAPVLPAAPALPPVDTATWVVEPGDSLWRIADDVVRTARPGASDRTVTGYWRSLVVANRAQLVDPQNPDLLVPGQQLALPPFAP